MVTCDVNFQHFGYFFMSDFSHGLIFMYFVNFIMAWYALRSHRSIGMILVFLYHCLQLFLMHYICGQYCARF